MAVLTRGATLTPCVLLNVLVIGTEKAFFPIALNITLAVHHVTDLFIVLLILIVPYGATYAYEFRVGFKSWLKIISF